MNKPGLFEGIIVAIVISLAGGILAEFFAVFGPTHMGIRLWLPLLVSGYLIYLLKRSEEHTGRIVMLALWFFLTVGGLLLEASLITFIVIQLAAIWIIRSLYFHASVLPSLLDLGLVGLGQIAAVWALLQTGSVMTSIWSFFLTQSLFVLIPAFKRNRDLGNHHNPVEQNRFQSAHRVALDAVRKLSTQ